MHALDAERLDHRLGDLAAGLRTPRPPLSGDVRRDLVEELTRFRAGALRPFGMSMLGTMLAEEHETPELLVSSVGSDRAAARQPPPNPQSCP